MDQLGKEPEKAEQALTAEQAKTMELEERLAKLNASSAPAKEDDKAGFGTIALCSFVIMAFIGWIGWLAVGGQEAAPKKMSEVQMRKSIAEAEAADPELKNMILLKKAAHGKAATIPTSKIDVNSATPEQLSKVPGLTEWDVNAIVKLRPFKSVDELLSKQALGEARYRDTALFLSAGKAN